MIHEELSGKIIGAAMGVLNESKPRLRCFSPKLVRGYLNHQELGPGPFHQF
jgi:hypothetical protein